jgi:hypothetical protein
MQGMGVLEGSRMVLTPDDLAAIRARDADWERYQFVDTNAAIDRHDLLAEVDRLTAILDATPGHIAQAMAYAHDLAIEHERARILAAVEGLPLYPGSRGREIAGGYVSRAAVIAIVKGEA